MWNKVMLQQPTSRCLDIEWKQTLLVWCMIIQNYHLIRNGNLLWEKSRSMQLFNKPLRYLLITCYKTCCLEAGLPWRQMEMTKRTQQLKQDKVWREVTSCFMTLTLRVLNRERFERTNNTLKEDWKKIGGKFKDH